MLNLLFCFLQLILSLVQMNLQTTQHIYYYYYYYYCYFFIPLVVKIPRVKS